MIVASPHGSKHRSIVDYTRHLQLLDVPYWPIENTTNLIVSQVCVTFYAHPGGVDRCCLLIIVECQYCAKQMPACGQLF